MYAKGKATREAFVAEAVVAAAELGLDAVSIRILSHRLGRSESILYRYFPSKDELFEEAFIRIEHSMSKHILMNNPLLSSKGDASFEDIAFSIWKDVYHFLLENRDEALFLIRYRYSSYYNDRVRNMRMAHNGGFEPVYKKMMEYRPEFTREKCAFLISYVFDMTLNLCEKIHTGRIEVVGDSEKGVWGIIMGVARAIASGDSIGLRGVESSYVLQEAKPQA